MKSRGAALVRLPAVVAAFLIGAISAGTLASSGIATTRRISALRGTVRSGDAAQSPLRRARVQLEGAALGRGVITVTDDSGHFAFEGIPPGTFSLTASKSGYLTMRYGATTPGRSGVLITVQDNEEIQDLKFVLPKGSVIFGRILNSFGQPQADASVSAFAFERRNGERVLATGSPSMLSNSRGEYRLWGLPAGEYVVAVTNAGNQSGEARQLTEAMVEQALRLPNQPSASDAPQTGFAPIFFPGTSEATMATVLSVGTGAEISNIDITLRPVTLARLVASATATTGDTVDQVRFWLAPKGPFIPGSGSRFSVRTGTSRPGEPNSFAGLSPGKYLLLAEGTNKVSGGVSMWSVRELQVNGLDQILHLTLERGGELSGQVAAQGGKSSSASLTGVRISLEWPVRVFGPQSPRFEVSTDSTGQFSLRSIPPGDYRLNVVPSASGNADGLTAQTALQDGRDLLDGFVSIRSDTRMADVSVTLSPVRAQVRGLLLDAGSIPTSDYTVVVFSQDKDHWYYQSRRVGCVRPSNLGEFLVPNLPAGQYSVVVARDLSSDDCYDPAVLGSFGREAIRFTLSQGEQKQLDLKAVR